ncbi:MAG: hypothetical protein O3A95_03625 [Planctomycetota bacterium]|nr:hypothetical protein [Planctomycetota bacterium]MDA1113371.1 hypothetical protein [Planctomycetota bacterium]
MIISTLLLASPFTELEYPVQMFIGLAMSMEMMAEEVKKQQGE